MSQLDHVNTAMLCRRLLALGMLGAYLDNSDGKLTISWSEWGDMERSGAPFRLHRIIDDRNRWDDSASSVLDALDRVDTWLAAAGHPPLHEQYSEERMPIF